MIGEMETELAKRRVSKDGNYSILKFGGPVDSELAQKRIHLTVNSVLCLSVDDIWIHQVLGVDCGRVGALFIVLVVLHVAYAFDRQGVHGA